MNQIHRNMKEMPTSNEKKEVMALNGGKICKWTYSEVEMIK